jgi:hypothetical protein
MKKMRIGLILIAIVLIVFGWGAYKEKEQKQQINTIINKQETVNQIEVKDQRTDKVIFSTKKEASQYKEKYPLSHIDKLDKADWKQFKADYIITYKINGKILYSVEILRLNKDASISTHLKPFLFETKGKTYMIYWTEQNKILEQSENTQKLLENL